MQAITKSRYPYCLPARRVPRAAYVPKGRTLLLVDLENLAGGPHVPLDSMLSSVAQFSRLSGLGPGDLAVVGTNPGLLSQASQLMPRARLVTQAGPDGADLALLREVRDLLWVAQRFDRVVIGSGDGIFSNVAQGLRNLGIAVGVVGPHGGIATRLAQSVDFVRTIALTRCQPELAC